MNKLTIAGAAALIASLATLSLPAAAQEPPRHPTPNGVLGFLDPATGAFRPVSQGETAPDLAPAAAPSLGKFVFNFSIKVESSIPSGQPIICSATAYVVETNTTTFQTNDFTEEASVTAARSGSNATCTVNIPYSWGLTTPASDIVHLSFTISSGALSSATAFARYSGQTLPSIKVPASGATTTETVKAVI